MFETEKEKLCAFFFLIHIRIEIVFKITKFCNLNKMNKWQKYRPIELKNNYYIDRK